ADPRVRAPGQPSKRDLHLLAVAQDAPTGSVGAVTALSIAEERPEVFAQCAAEVVEPFEHGGGISGVEPSEELLRGRAGLPDDLHDEGAGILIEPARSLGALDPQVSW